MKFKSDWPEAQRRLTALWHHERLDRPCIAVPSCLQQAGWMPCKWIGAGKAGAR